MKNKGFTLIELLAVIVILSIIAVITVPMIMNVIDKAKLGALEDSAYGLIESANLYYSENVSSITDKVMFDFKNGEQTSTTKLNYKGKIDNGKLILNTDGKVVTCIDNGTNYAYKELSESKVVTGKGTCSYDGNTGDFTIVSDTDTLNKKVTELQSELNELKSIGNATASDILEGKTAIVQGEKITGINKGYDIGYTNGYNDGIAAGGSSKYTVASFSVNKGSNVAWTYTETISNYTGYQFKSIAGCSVGLSAGYNSSTTNKTTFVSGSASGNTLTIRFSGSAIFVSGDIVFNVVIWGERA